LGQRTFLQPLVLWPKLHIQISLWSFSFVHKLKDLEYYKLYMLTFSWILPTTSHH
jgi:hypothetical protein